MKIKTAAVMGMALIMLLLSGCGGEDIVQAVDTLLSGSTASEDGQLFTDTAAELGDALAAAKDYLSNMSFSAEELVDLLKLDGYTDEEARSAVDNCGADWKEQALSEAKEFVSSLALSHTGLIEQLEQNEYTAEEAAYAADNCGADWKEQALKWAKDHPEVANMSRQELIDKLVSEGFAEEEAEYGVSQFGY